MMNTTDLYPTGLLAPDVVPESAQQTAPWQALATVIDPEIRQPITTLGMVSAVEFSETDDITVVIRLAIAGLPIQDSIHNDVAKSLARVAAGEVSSRLASMPPEQRVALQEDLTANLNRYPCSNESFTKSYAVASGKGGVGKSTNTANLAVGLAD